MKTINAVIFITFFTLALSPNLIAQNNPENNSGFEIGIDFARFNRNWVYSSDRHPNDGHEYAFDFLPSIFIKLPKDKYSIRFKYEYFTKNYASKTNSLDGNEAFEGGFKENRVFLGIERYITNKRIRIYCLSDIGLSIANYKGKYSYPKYDYSSVIMEYFNITQFSLSLQPGVGIKFNLSNKLALNLESSIFIGKGFQKSDGDYFLPTLRFTPRPVSLFGLSYKFN